MKCRDLWWRPDGETRGETFVRGHLWWDIIAQEERYLQLRGGKTKRYTPPPEANLLSLQNVVWLGKTQQLDVRCWWRLLANTAVFNAVLNLLCISFLYALMLLSNSSYAWFGGEKYVFALEMPLLFSWSVSRTLYLSYYTVKIILPVSHPFSASF